MVGGFGKHPAEVAVACGYVNARSKTRSVIGAWTAIGFVDGSEILGLWFRLPSWFPLFLMDFVRDAVPE